MMFKEETTGRYLMRIMQAIQLSQINRLTAGQISMMDYNFLGFGFADTGRC